MAHGRGQIIHQRQGLSQRRHRDSKLYCQKCGVNLSNVALAHIDSSWIYQGNRDYRGLLVERDLTALADEKATEVKQWIAGAQSTIALDSEPQIDAGVHCFSPYDCGFYNYCTQGAPQAEFPINWLPRASKQIKTWAQDNDEIEAANVPDELLNLKQQRVKDATIKQTPYFDKVATQAELKSNTNCPFTSSTLKPSISPCRYGQAHAPISKSVSV